MTLRRKILLYLGLLHAALATACVFVLLEWPLLLFALEAVFAISVWVSFRLVRQLFVPLDLIGTGADLIAERDFTTHFVPMGQVEMDRLIAVYNAMIDRLREERLSAEEQHELLERLISASPSGVVICNFEGDVAQMNPAARQLVTSEILAEMRQMKAGESRLVLGLAPQRLKVWRTEFRDRGFSKTFFVIEELTEELRLSEKAAYEKLIRMMSHEVNNSVGAVRSLLESSLRYGSQLREEDRVDFSNALTVAAARIDALNRFMRGFADVVRIPPPHRAPVRVADVVTRLATLLRPELQERSIGLDLDLDDSEALIDVHQFEQVLLNILRNAIDAIGGNGSIRVTVHAGRLSVADSGSGISSDVARDLFTPFFTTRREGRGLGLTIVQEILTSHGFSFSLSNRAERGAEFVIRL